MSLGVTCRPPRSFPPAPLPRAGRAVPGLARCPSAGDNDSGALQRRREGRAALARRPVPHGARQTFAFKVRTGLDQRRETFSVPKQPPGGPDRTERFLARSPGPCPVPGVLWQQAACWDCQQTGEPGCHRPATRRQRQGTPDTSFPALRGGAPASDVEKTSALFLAGFSSPKAVWEGTGKRREINDFPAAGGRAER